jgi:hypothetical protein
MPSSDIPSSTGPKPGQPLAIPARGHIEPGRESLARFDESGITVIRTLSPGEGDLLRDAANYIRRHGRQHAYSLVLRSADQLEAIRNDIVEALESGQLVILPRAADELSAALVGWTTLMRLFLEHADRDLRKRFGDQSEQYEAFKASQSAAFDGYFGYRFAVRFRNYIEHREMPPLEVGLQPGPDKAAKKIATHLIVALNRDRLLESDRWGSITTELRTQPEHIELEPLITQAMSGLRLVLDAVLMADIEKLGNHRRLLASMVEEVGSGTVPCLVRVEAVDPPVVMLPFQRSTWFDDLLPLIRPSGEQAEP